MNKAYKKFLLIWVGAFISAIGSGVTSFGLGVYIFETTGYAGAAGAVILAGFLPSLLLGPFAGILADRFDRRKLMIIGDGFSAFGILLILIFFKISNLNLPIIIIGLVISSIFSSLVEPAFKATISDMLSKEMFSKASGLMQIINSAKFLISPILAGLMLKYFDLSYLLIFDILTVFPMVLLTNYVRKDITRTMKIESEHFLKEMKEGFETIKSNEGIWKLVVLGSGISFFLGTFQTLSSPFILSFSNSDYLGFTISISALGILFSSGIIGVLNIKSNFHKILCASLIMSGIFMVFFGIRENEIIICVSGFLFFSMLPFANMSLDYLIRTNITENIQGRAWGFIGFISQIGYVIAYGTTGQLADYVFVPMFKREDSIIYELHELLGNGKGSGFAFVIILSGLFLSLLGFLLLRDRSIKKLEV